MEKKPLKRIAGLKPYSIDHHQGLLLCWKIRTGLKNNIAPARIAAYVQWFYKNELLPHFELEEKFIFPVLGGDNSLVRQAVSEHKMISLLIHEVGGEESLLQLAEVLEKHIRFEERILFEEVQKCATPEELAEIEKVLWSKIFVADTSDEVWNMISV